MSRKKKDILKTGWSNIFFDTRNIAQKICFVFIRQSKNKNTFYLLALTFL